MYGFSGLVNGNLSSNKKRALARLRKRGFKEVK